MVGIGESRKDWHAEGKHTHFFVKISVKKKIIFQKLVGKPEEIHNKRRNEKA